MGILDNDTVVVDAILTKLGRQKLANGEPLGITKFAFGDTGVDYTLYNPDHPSGSDSYGNAITNLPMLEAVPDDNVFLRSKLWGTGERNVQNFSFITITSGTSVTIAKIPGQTSSHEININPDLFPSPNSFPSFNFKILDARGLRFPGGGNNSDSEMQFTGGFSINDWPPFDHPEPIIATFSNFDNMTIGAQPQQITSQKSIGVEVTREGAAPAFVTVTVEANNQA